MCFKSPEPTAAKDTTPDYVPPAQTVTYSNGTTTSSGVTEPGKARVRKRGSNPFAAVDAVPMLAPAARASSSLGI